MGKPYSQDLRERVIAAVDTATGAYVAALLFQVSVSYIYKALIRRRKTGEVTARRSGCGPKPKLAPHDDALRARSADYMIGRPLTLHPRPAFYRSKITHSGHSRRTGAAVKATPPA